MTRRNFFAVLASIPAALIATRGKVEAQPSAEHVHLSRFIGEPLILPTAKGAEEPWILDRTKPFRIEEWAKSTPMQNGGSCTAYKYVAFAAYYQRGQSAQCWSFDIHTWGIAGGVPQEMAAADLLEGERLAIRAAMDGYAPTGRLLSPEG